MKLLGYVMIIFTCTAYGFYKSHELQTRCKSLLEFKLVLKNLKTEIEFLKNELCTSLKNSSAGSDLETLFFDFADAIGSYDINKAWEMSLIRTASSLCFNSEDIRILKKLSCELGKTDVKNQLSHIDFMLSVINERYILALEEYKTKSGIFKSGGMAFGVLTVLLLI